MSAMTNLAMRVNDDNIVNSILSRQHSHFPQCSFLLEILSQNVICHCWVGCGWPGKSQLVRCEILFYVPVH